MFVLCITVILGKSHYILYGLVAAMQPRMLVTFDEELRPLPVSVRVGQVNSAELYIFQKTFDTHGEDDECDVCSVCRR